MAGKPLLQTKRLEQCASLLRNGLWNGSQGEANARIIGRIGLVSRANREGKKESFRKGKLRFRK